MEQKIIDAIQRSRAGIRINFTTKTEFGEWTEIIQQLQLALREGGVQQVETVFRTFMRVEPQLAALDNGEYIYPSDISLDQTQLAALDRFTYIGDIGLAQAIAHLWRKNLRYVPGLGWFIWTGQRWIVDPCSAIYQYAIVCVRARQNAVYAREVDSEDGRAKKIKDIQHAINAERRARTNDAIKIAETMPDMVVPADKLDANDGLLACSNGTIDLSTGKLLTSTPELLITKKTDIPYYPEAECPRWEQFISEIFGGDSDMVDYVQRICGYALTGYTREQAFWILYGMGSNGKSTFLNVLYQVAGEYGSNAPFNTFSEGKNTQAGDDIARLRGQRVVMASETSEGNALNEERIKSITGGDVITARFLYGRYFEFHPKFKVILAVNHKPIIRGTDRGIWRRVKLLPFKVSFEKRADKDLESKLMAEIAGILTWCVKGAVRWHKYGMSAPQSVLDATEAYQSEMDTIGQFLDENTITKPYAQVKSLDLYTRYQDWTKDNGLRPLSNRKFSKSLQERGMKSERITAGYFWLDIELL